jgi:hypothetical protein
MCHLSLCTFPQDQTKSWELTIIDGVVHCSDVAAHHPKFRNVAATNEINHKGCLSSKKHLSQQSVHQPDPQIRKRQESKFHLGCNTPTP